MLIGIIADREDWLSSPANIKGANKDAKIYVGRSKTLHNLLFCPHTLCMSYATNTFLLVSSSVRSKQLLCFAQSWGQKREQQHSTKIKNFEEFHNHSPLLTLLELINIRYMSSSESGQHYNVIICNLFALILWNQITFLTYPGVTYNY